MLKRLLKSTYVDFYRQSRRFESISVGSVRAGMILKLDGQHVEVKKYEPKREGRGGAMGAVCNIGILSISFTRLNMSISTLRKLAV
jgi:hypothetical protein